MLNNRFHFEVALNLWVRTINFTPISVHKVIVFTYIYKLYGDSITWYKSKARACRLFSSYY